MTNEIEYSRAIRMNSARAVAQWELGDPSWADTIIAAFENPQADWVLEIIREVNDRADSD